MDIASVITRIARGEVSYALGRFQTVRTCYSAVRRLLEPKTSVAHGAAGTKTIFPDLDIAAARYLHSLDDGEIPLLLLFSGTLFYAGDAGVQVGLVPWHEEAAHGLPVGVWRAAMDAFHPGGGWVRLRRDTLDRLSAYRSAHTLPTWDDALERLLKEAGDG